MASAPSDGYLGPVRVASSPGVKRDGTVLDSDHCVDARWTRWARGLPKKMRGYRTANGYLSEVVRALHSQTADGKTYIHMGAAASVEQLYLESPTLSSGVTDRTPTTGLTASADNMWQFAAVTSGGTSTLVAQVAPNLDCICSTDPGALFTGDLYGSAALAPVTTVPANWDASGGVAVLFPYTVVLGQNGYVAWSVPGSPDDFTGSGAGNAYVTSQKLLRGMPLRNGPGNNPAGLLWSADSLLLMSYVGGTATFDFSHLSTQISVLGQNTIVEYDGVFYWAGTDRFLMFNGVVRDVPNQMNLDWFYDNINLRYRQKCFAFANKRDGEIWWCFPFGDATECSHAVIFNVREGVWYDTQLPNTGRAAGHSPSVFPKPILTGVDAQPSRAITASVSAGGSGYTAGDILTVQGGAGSAPAQLKVLTVSGGAVATVAVVYAGAYTNPPADPAGVTGGSGSGATFDITYSAPYRLWVHETGFDEVADGVPQPVRAYFRTSRISLPAQGDATSSLTLSTLEPDFDQVGDMTVTAFGRYNARSPEFNSPTFTFAEDDGSLIPEAQLATFKFNARHMWLQFESNTLGGDFRAGRTLAHLRIGGDRVR